MSITVLEFFLFQQPFSIAALISIVQKYSGKLTMDSEIATLTTSLWLIDSTVNPLWITIFSTRRNENPRSSQRHSDHFTVLS